ncbi:hypothetical protein HWV62_2127 [Athelia sp. TMB]|nr:hypothetical protein HWV62_2127 [Athelia sp. TMB]
MAGEKKGHILSVNSGSSSLKISLYRLSQQSNGEPIELLITSSISNISSPPAKFTFEPVSGKSQEGEVDSIKDHTSAFAHFLDSLKKEASINRDDIAHVCHRVVHGGDYTGPVIISEDSFRHIEELTDLAPLHNGAALSVIKACIEALPKSNSIAYFDSAFHRSIPRHISTYAIDYKVAEQKGLKKYGFHDAFILRSVAAYLQKPSDSLNLILCHLGSGASVCAIKNGKSLDTSMGLTPLNGLPGATRSGVVDPSLIFHFTNTAGKISHDPEKAKDLHAEDILNTQSGWKSLTGTTDFGEITSKAELGSAPSDDNRYRLAFDLFTDRILNYIGSYHLKLGGQVDALVFAGGIGERGSELRERIGKAVECLGFPEIDRGKNQSQKVKEGGVVVEIDNAESGKRVLVCKTDEQLEMARQCALEKKFWN